MDPSFSQIALITVLLIVALMGVIFLVLFAKYFNLWLRGFVTRARIGPLSLVFMSLRKVNPNIIVDSKITAVQAGIPGISTEALEAHYLAGGNLRNVIRALIAAHRAKIDLDWDTATAIDLAGRNVLEAVQTSVDPKVIDCPDSRRHGRMTLDGVARDGIQLKARARVTVRTNLAQLIGGATEETVIARVGEGIVSAIGSCETHKQVLANPVLIAKTVLNKGLDSQTAYEIVSIDIADIDVGDNIGARLQADQAEADMRIARAKAEERRARAVATEQEMRATTQQNRAYVVLAEAEVPKAMAEAFLGGSLRADASATDGNGEATGRSAAAETSHLAAAHYPAAELRLKGDRTVAVCPGCGARYNVTDVHGNADFDRDPDAPGQQVHCRKCDTTFTLPEEAETEG
ncbi:MAG: flotillin-like protein FloA [Planctomycetales bacterium]